MAVSVVSLRNGFSRLDTDGVTMFANGSSTLVKGSDGLHVVVDALTAWDGDIMQQGSHPLFTWDKYLCYFIYDICFFMEHSVFHAALKKEGLHCDDIKFVVCTHSHSDHIGLLSLFSKADRHCVGYTLSHHQTFFSHPFDKVDLNKSSAFHNCFDHLEKRKLYFTFWDLGWRIQDKWSHKDCANSWTYPRWC